MKGIKYAVLLLLACYALTAMAGSAGKVKRDDALLSTTRVNVDLWQFSDTSFNLERRELVDDIFGYYGCDVLSGRKCNRKSSCIWIKEKGEPGTCKATADVECDEVKGGRRCRNKVSDRCYWAGWKNSGCTKIDNDRECSTVAKKLCTALDSCVWLGRRKDGECRDLDDIECSELDGKKRGCERAGIKCSFIGKSKRGKCKLLEDIVCSKLNFFNCRQTKKCSWEGKKNEGSCQDDG